MLNLTDEKTRVTAHVLAWVATLGLSLFLIQGDYVIIRSFLFLAQIIFLVYSSVYYSIPRYLQYRRISTYLLVSLVQLIIASAFNVIPRIFLDYGPRIDLTIEGRQISERIYYWDSNFSWIAIALFWIANMFYNFWVLLVITVVKLAYDSLKNRYRIEVMAKEKLGNELKYLREQNKPHFLFNNLNSLYVLIDEDPEKAKKALLKLSDMLRFQLYESQVSRISLEKEVNYINNYIDLQKLRLSDDLRIEVNWDGAMNGQTIEPYLLFTFVENAFKHGVNKHPEHNYIRIAGRIDKESLVFEVENPIGQPNDVEKMHNPGEGGFGLMSLRKKLSVFYPGNHDLKIFDDGEVYRVTLKLELS